MTRRRFLSLSVALSAALALWTGVAAAQVATRENSAVKPAPRNNKWWMDRHQKMNDRVKQRKSCRPARRDRTPPLRPGPPGTSESSWPQRPRPQPPDWPTT